MIDALRARNRIQSILALLAQERKAILNGPLSDLSEMVTKRENLLDSLMDVKTALSEVDLKSVQKEAQTNERLLKASLKGLREANRMIAEQRRAATSMGTYTNKGERLEAENHTDLADRMA